VLIVGALASPVVAQSCAPPAPDLVSWWPGDGNANDWTANNPGTAENGTGFAPGLVRQAFSFDGVDDYVDVPDSPSLDGIKAQVSVDFWIRPNSAQRWERNMWIFARRDPLTSEGFSILITPDGQVVVNLRTTTSWTPSGTILESDVSSPVVKYDEWQHLAVTADTELGQVSAYVDGRPVPLQRVYGPPVSGTLFDVNHLFMGRRQSLDTVEGETLAGHFAGEIDEVGVFARSLTQEEIGAIYRAGSAGRCQARVGIDIKPGSYPNTINPQSRGTIPVAVLTTAKFDASVVDPTSCRFGPTGTEAAAQRWAREDVDADGDTDLILHFPTQSAGLMCGATSARLTGRTATDRTIYGVDSLQTVGCTAAGATEGTRFITTSTTLTEDHRGSLVIDADHVVLDCAGHTISYVDVEDAPEDGIEIYGRTDATIRNCVINNFRRFGVYVAYSNGITLIGNATSANGEVGFFLEGSSGNALRDNKSSINFHDGFQMFESSNDNVLSGNSAMDNGNEESGGVGFVVRGSSGNALDGNVADNSREFGFLVEDSSGNTFTGNRTASNGMYGLYLLWSSENAVYGNTTAKNGETGVFLEGSSGNTVRDNRSSGNFHDGFQMFESSNDNTLSGNRAMANGNEESGGMGFVVRGSSGNALDGNAALNSREAGFLLEDSSENGLSENRASSNLYGFLLRASSWNELSRNKACGNEIADLFQDESSSDNEFIMNHFCNGSDD
jgi:parallel beta-helix repeat protein